MGIVRLIGRERLNPGEECEIEVSAMPRSLWAGVRSGAVIEVREGPRLVGRATITSVARADESTTG